MAVPDYQSLMLPALQLMSDGEERTRADIRQILGVRLRLSEEDLAERLPSNTQTMFANRCAWAVQYLKAAGLIQLVRRGVYVMGERGRAVLAAPPPAITAKFLRQYPEFLEFMGGGAADETVVARAASAVESKATPEEILDRTFQAMQESLAEELLETMLNGTPAAFEQVVVNLLVAMGYGGSVGDAGKVVGRSGDGGIDGVIKQDKLGLDSIYVQAKRWQGSVGSPEIMKFSGGLTKRHASRGVFITTSTFTKDATEFVEALPQKIVLVDGKQLAALMIEHGVGVSTTRTIELKRLDQDYFDNM